MRHQPQGDVGARPVQDAAGHQPSHHPGQHRGVPKEVEGQHRLSGAPLLADEQHRHRGGTQRREKLKRAGQVVRLEGKENEGQRASGKQRPGPLQAVRLRAGRVSVGGLQEKGGGQAHRDIHPKHPAPTGVLGEKGAENGADDGGHAPASGEDALDGRALLEVVDVRGNGERRGLERPGTQALHHPEGDELRARTSRSRRGWCPEGRRPVPRETSPCGRCRRPDRRK